MTSQTVAERPAAKSITVKTSPEWLAWLGRLARHVRAPASVTIDMAVTEFAKRTGYDEAPPQR